MKQPLTPKELLVFTYIAAYIEDKKFAPTLKEIAQHIKTTDMRAHDLVLQLTDKGWLIHYPKRHRGLQVKN